MTAERTTRNLRRSQTAATAEPGMMHPLKDLRDEALREIESAPNEQTLEALRVKYLGRSGSISNWGEKMKSLSKEERPVVGKHLNEARTAITSALEQAEEKLRAARET